MSEANTARIRGFILQNFPAARKRRINDDSPLLESGVIDSLGMLDIVKFLEQTFEIKVEDEELSPDNFASIRCLSIFVMKKSALAAGVME
jgi:acyl carrier protein